MDQNATGINLLQALYGGGSAMRRAIVDDPEQPCAGTVRFLCQHLVDQSAKGFNPGRRFTAPYHIPPVYIPCGEILQGPTALVFVLDIGRSAWPGRQRGMTADAGLNTGLLVGTEDVVLGAKALALPLAPIEVQNRASFLGKVGITWKEPVLVPPGFERILIQNAPHRAPTDGFAQGFLSPCRDIGQGLPTQRLLGFGDQFTGDGLNQRVVQGGKKPPYGPGPARPPRKSPSWPNGDASVAPNVDATGPVPQPRCWTQAGVGAKVKLAWLVAATGTARSSGGQSVQPAPRKSRETQDGSSVGDHAWETSFDDSDLSVHQNASHCSHSPSPKTMTLFLKRST